MARLDFEEFLDKEVTRVYMAGGLEEAKRVESILTGHGIDYVVDIEPYRKQVLGISPVCTRGLGSSFSPRRQVLLVVRCLLPV
jgi:hypothetical protein